MYNIREHQRARGIEQAAAAAVAATADGLTVVGGRRGNHDDRTNITVRCATVTIVVGGTLFDVHTAAIYECIALLAPKNNNYC